MSTTAHSTMPTSACHAALFAAPRSNRPLRNHQSSYSAARAVIRDLAGQQLPIVGHDRRRIVTGRRFFHRPFHE